MRGYKNVIEKSKELNAKGVYSPIAIETSGHAAFMENYFLDDGAYVVTKLLICLATLKNGEKLTDLIKDLPEPAECAEVRITFSDAGNFKADGNRVIEELKTLAGNDGSLKLADTNYEGARINFGKDNGDGWLLIRMSVHDPVMPINFESNTVGGNKIMAERLLEALKGYKFLNTDNLKKFIQN